MSLSRAIRRNRERTKPMPEPFTPVLIPIRPGEGAYGFKVKAKARLRPIHCVGNTIICEAYEGGPLEYEFAVVHIGSTFTPPQDVSYVGLAVFPSPIVNGEPKFAAVYQVGKPRVPAAEGETH